MKILKTSIDDFDESVVSEAIKVMADGGVVLYPTDTVYGLGVNIFDNAAVRRIYDIKKRSLLKPLSILISDFNALDLVSKVPLAHKQIMAKYLPGPYTFILKKSPIVPRVITSGSAFVGVRIPDCALACSMAGLFPITTTSANISDESVMDSPQDILEQLDCDVDLVIDAGPIMSDRPSTIVDLSSFEPKIIKRD